MKHYYHKRSAYGERSDKAKTFELNLNIKVSQDHIQMLLSANT